MTVRRSSPGAGFGETLSNLNPLLGCNSDLAQQSHTPSLRVAGFEDSLSAVADGLKLRPAESRPRKRGSAPKIGERSRENEASGEPLVDPLWRSPSLVGHIVGFHGFRYLWRGCRSAGWFAYRPDIIVTKGAAGNAQPPKCERCRHKSYQGKPKISTDHESNNWRERTLVARSTLCEATTPVERQSTRMNGSGAWPWSAGFRAATHGRQHTR